MTLALLALVVNLIYPRSSGVKVGIVLSLIYAAAVFCFISGSEVSRPLNEILHTLPPAEQRRLLPGSWPSDVPVAVSVERARALVDRQLFGLWLYLSAGLLLVLVPSDALTRLTSAWQRWHWGAHYQPPKPKPAAPASDAGVSREPKTLGRFLGVRRSQAPNPALQRTGRGE